ncbi:hypothetical protein ILUMI_08266 [Ignelater luminosus]|uniref:HTH CENPB-type domain-containing protein n=1 Tax=Ignelater luminosus TaxID=2038154 RepID=A0A8K0D295_IGNLU|nr:hypothetical protein ILUMI_08266 [Ignelater luminosus]
MGRNRKCPRKIGNFDEEIMKHTVLKVVNKSVPIRRAAVDASLIPMTLKRYVDKYKNAPEEERESLRFAPNYEANKVFPKVLEDVLEEYLKTASKRNSLKYPLSWNRNEQAGEEWLSCFLSRHQCLSIRKPEPASLGRATIFNRTNVHETERLKRIGQTTSGERGVLVTACCFINATGGGPIPPFFVFPRVHLKTRMLTGAPPRMTGTAVKDDDFLSSSATDRPMYKDSVTTNNNDNTVRNLTGIDVTLEEPLTSKYHLIDMAPEKSTPSSQGEAFQTTSVSSIKREYDRLNLSAELRPTSIRFRSYASYVFKPLGVV